MFTENEKFLPEYSVFDDLCRRKEIDGWHFVGRENLTRPQFTDKALFEEVQYQTKDQIIEKYLTEAKKQNPTAIFEVELVLDEGTEKLRRLKELATDEEYRYAIENISPADVNYFVFVREVTG
jgi:hypothetical protein